MTLLVAERTSGEVGGAFGDVGGGSGGVSGEPGGMGDHAVIGCALLQREGERIEFGLFAVDPTAQSAGTGRTLLEQAAQIARDEGKHALMIRVLEGRPELVAWYERRGFRTTGTTSPFPADPALLRVPELRMQEMLLPL